jgi:D-arabinose 1-dehydrogenase-like Zn-dependent alcohol dehydrogenase
MVLERPGTRLRLEQISVPAPGPGQVLLEVHACGICRTDLHVVDGELTEPKLPIVPGHQIVGVVLEAGEGVERPSVGDRVGVPWLGWTCGECVYCRTGRENLCDRARFTGYQIDGGYADYTIADSRFCLPIPDGYPDLQAAPLLCAGLIGYRCLRAAGDAPRLGIYGFGSAGHILIQVARHRGQRVFAFTRPGDDAAQAFRHGAGRRLGWYFGRPAARAARRRDHLRSSGRAGAGSTEGGSKRWNRGVWGHPHVRHPDLSLLDPVGRADASIRGQPDARRRRGISTAGADHPDSFAGSRLSARPDEPSFGRPS